MHEVQVPEVIAKVAAQDVIAQVVAGKEVIANVVVSRVGLLLVGDLQDVQEELVVELFRHTFIEILK